MSHQAAEKSLCKARAAAAPASGSGAPGATSAGCDASANKSSTTSEPQTWSPVATSPRLKHRPNGSGTEAEPLKISQNMSMEEIAVFHTTLCAKKRNLESRCELEQRCPYSHCLSWHRRNPFEVPYRPNLCPNVRFWTENSKLRVKSYCHRGRSCVFAHTKEEQMYHPLVYKTQLCRDWPFCDKYYCPFAHGGSEIRNSGEISYNLPKLPDGASPPPSSSLAQRRHVRAATTGTTSHSQTVSRYPEDSWRAAGAERRESVTLKKLVTATTAASSPGLAPQAVPALLDSSSGPSLGFGASSSAELPPAPVWTDFLERSQSWNGQTNYQQCSEAECDIAALLSRCDLLPKTSDFPPASPVHSPAINAHRGPAPPEFAANSQRDQQLMSSIMSQDKTNEIQDFSNILYGGAASTPLASQSQTPVALARAVSSEFDSFGASHFGLQCPTADCIPPPGLTSLSFRHSGHQDVPSMLSRPQPPPPPPDCPPASAELRSVLSNAFFGHQGSGSSGSFGSNPSNTPPARLNDVGSFDNLRNMHALKSRTMPPSYLPALPTLQKAPPYLLQQQVPLHPHYQHYVSQTLPPDPTSNGQHLGPPSPQVAIAANSGHPYNSWLYQDAMINDLSALLSSLPL